MSALRQKLEGGGSVTLSDLDRFETEAATNVSRTLAEATFQVAAGNHLVVSVAGCNTTDLKKALPEIAKAARAFPLVSERGNVLRRQAHQLKLAGARIAAISRDLGVERSTIRRWLSEPLVDPERGPGDS